MLPSSANGHRTLWEEPVTSPFWQPVADGGVPPNKGMKLTKLSAAWSSGWTCRLMPAPARSDAGTASQLIPGVGPTKRFFGAVVTDRVQGMSWRMRPAEQTLLLGVVGVGVLSATLDAKWPQGQSAFCRTPESEPASASAPQTLQLRPRDEGPTRPDFAEFRRRLRDAVARKDTAAVLRVVDPAVRLDFDAGIGIDAFKRRVDEAFWEELGKVLAMGGRFSTPTTFEAPYVSSDWPDYLDPIECFAVIGSGVRLRNAPDKSARVLMTLDFAVVHVFLNEPEIRGWQRVELVSGNTGYVASTLLRSAIDYRAYFERKMGSWYLVAFVAGD
jgi:hypothetical protein